MTQAPSTDVDLVFTQALQAAQKPGISLASLAGILAGPDVPLTPPAQPFPDPAPALQLTDEVRDALKALPRVFAKVQPSERRSLTEEELVQITEERETLNALLDLLGKRKEAIGTIIRHHQDVEAESAGLVVPKAKTARNGEIIVEASPRDSQGHYLLGRPKNPFKTPVPKRGKAWSQQYSSGSVQYSSDQALQAAESEGKLSHDDYLAITTATRVVDQGKIQSLIAKDPARGLRLLRLVVRRGTPSGALFLRKL